MSQLPDYIEVFFVGNCQRINLHLKMEGRDWSYNSGFHTGQGYAVEQLVEALLCELKRRGFDSQWGH
jgi:hypothetical protein